MRLFQFISLAMRMKENQASILEACHPVTYLQLLLGRLHQRGVGGAVHSGGAGLSQTEQLRLRLATSR